MSKHCTNPEVEVEQVSEDTIIVRFADEINPRWPFVIREFKKRVLKRWKSGIIDWVSSYASVMIQYDLLRLPLEEEIEALRQLASAVVVSDIVEKANTTKVLPICFDESFALDLGELCRSARKTSGEWKEIYLGNEYVVYAVGFKPGFPYMGEIDEAIASSRHAEPRQMVPQGSVGIADRQTGVYPDDSPGGWNIIGNCPLKMWEVEKIPSSLLQAGDCVKWVEIDLDVHREITERGMEYWKDWFRKEGIESC